MFAIMCVVLVILSVYFLLACSSTHEIKEVSKKIDDVGTKLAMYQNGILEYPKEKKSEDAICVKDMGVTTALDGTMTLDATGYPELEPEPEKEKPKRKPRKKTRTCENCANFVPIKEPKKRSTKKKEDENDGNESTEKQ